MPEKGERKYLLQLASKYTVELLEGVLFSTSYGTYLPTQKSIDQRQVLKSINIFNYINKFSDTKIQLIFKKNTHTIKMFIHTFSYVFRVGNNLKLSILTMQSLTLCTRINRQTSFCGNLLVPDESVYNCPYFLCIIIKSILRADLVTIAISQWDHNEAGR